ncbi:MAG: ferrous iron transport protein B, partial [Prevotella sp.]
DSEAGQGESRYEKLHTLMVGDVAQMHGLAPSDGRVEAVATLTAFCFLLFVLLYFPCLATIAAIKGETGSWKWALFAAAYTTLTAWVVSALVFRIGLLFI